MNPIYDFRGQVAVVRRRRVTCDVSDEAQVTALVARTVDTFGRLD